MTFQDVPATRGSRAGTDTGLTRIDLLALLAAAGVLGMVSWPALAESNSSALRALCVGNLERIGEAFETWGADRSEGLPWRVSPAEGGTLGSKAGNGWLEFAHVSNYLASPSLLVCPADTETRLVARDFSNDPEGGLLHFSFRANAISYLLGLDALRAFPQAWVSGDRNLRVDGINEGCSSGVNNAAGYRAFPDDSIAGWTNGIHEFQGNILHYDGHVSQFTSEELRTNSPTADENGNIHLLMPR